MTPGRSPKPPTFFSLHERILGWASVLLFVALFPLFVTWLFVSPRHGLGASWKPVATSVTTWLLLANVGGFVLAGVLYTRAKARSRRLLCERDYLACPGCGYDLRGVALPGSCPECGAASEDAGRIRAHWRRQYPAGDPSRPGAEVAMRSRPGGV